MSSKQLNGWVSVGTIGLFAAAVLVLLASDATAQDKAPAKEDVVLVDAEGEGMTKDDALKAALRNALEKGGKQEIFSDSKVENFQLMHDTIISRAQGIVKDYKIVEEKKVVGGGIKILIKAKVSKSVLATSWGEVQNVLKQMGKPKILVSIEERIDGKTEKQSGLAMLIQKPLLASGFELVSAQGAEAIRAKESEDAAAEDNIRKVQAIAKDFGAQIFIIGTANANQAGMEDLYGTPVAFYNSDAQVEVYYTDTARLMASEMLPVTRGGARGRKEFSPQAGKMALANSSQTLVDSLYAQIMERWATDISAGGELILEIENLKFKGANDLKKLIADIEGVEDVNFKLTKGIAQYRIRAKMSAEQLAEKLSEGAAAEIFEIEDLKLNRIQGKAPEE
ncbi:MAG: hypothetical protein JXA69_18245 [Phycisphaerae bacterium]|nr:hypothetical protein [Phycisphaerae bacterium]